MKKKLKFALLSLAGATFLFFFVYNIIMLITNFITPTGFNLKPLLWCVVFLILSLLTVGGFVSIIGEKEMKKEIEDEFEWWKKWDQV